MEREGRCPSTAVGCPPCLPERPLLLPPTPTLGLGKLLAALSVAEFPVNESMSPSDPHGVPGDTTGGPSPEGGCQPPPAGTARVPCQHASTGSASALSLVPDGPAPEHGPCLTEGDPRGHLGLEMAPACLGSRSAPALPPPPAPGPLAPSTPSPSFPAAGSQPPCSSSSWLLELQQPHPHDAHLPCLPQWKTGALACVLTVNSVRRTWLVLTTAISQAPQRVSDT